MPVNLTRVLMMVLVLSGLSACSRKIQPNASSQDLPIIIQGDIGEQIFPPSLSRHYQSNDGFRVDINSTKVDGYDYRYEFTIKSSFYNQTFQIDSHGRGLDLGSLEAFKPLDSEYYILMTLKFGSTISCFSNNDGRGVLYISISADGTREVSVVEYHNCQPSIIDIEQMH